MEQRFETFTVLITKISRSIRRIKTEEMAEFDLKSPHVSCIYYLYRNGEMSAKELCDVCDEDKAAISRAIGYLEDNGYIECNSKAEKRYKSPLRLTANGKKIGAKVADKIDNILKLANPNMSDNELKQFYQSLTTIANNLQKICEGYGE